MGDILKKVINVLGVILILAFAFLIIFKPTVCTNSALSGILLCGNIIIPTIYPFTFCVLFIKNSGALRFLKPLNNLTNRIFGLNYYEFAIFLLSLIGGYPLGARLLADSKLEKTPIMINYCVNAGPAFIILAIGKGVFNSAKIGWILFFSHISSSLIIALFSKRKFKFSSPPKTEKSLNCVDNFVTSAAAAAQTIINICSVVIIFSVVSGYIGLFSQSFKPLYFLGLLCEITNSVFKCNNVLTVSFLLGFAGFGIWSQIFSILKLQKINYAIFMVFRLIHGFLSAVITLILLKVLKLTAYTLSNGIGFVFLPFTNGPIVAFSLVITGIVLIISLYGKKYVGNLMEDIV